MKHINLNNFMVFKSPLCKHRNVCTIHLLSQIYKSSLYVAKVVFCSQIMGVVSTVNSISSFEMLRLVLRYSLIINIYIGPVTLLDCLMRAYPWDTVLIKYAIRIAFKALLLLFIPPKHKPLVGGYLLSILIVIGLLELTSKYLSEK